MADSRVFFVHLRRPRTWDEDEKRDDPFYEFGSFGCTGCHSGNLFHPKHAEDLEGARLAFVQGGRQGTRLVFLTPPVEVVKWADRCEARWKPAKPFKYEHAPVLATNRGSGDFARIDKFARDTDRTSVEGGLSSRVRNRTRALEPELAAEVIRVYESKRAHAPRSALAATYADALPYAPPDIDEDRKRTYGEFVKKLKLAAGGGRSATCLPKRPKTTGSRGPC